MHGSGWITALAAFLAAAAIGVPVAAVTGDPGPASEGRPASDTLTRLSSPSPVTASTPPVTARTRGRLVVGDSLTVGARVPLRKRGFAVHAKVGRQFSAAPGILRGYGPQLPFNVVIALGTNGPVTLSTCKAVVRIVGEGRRVFLVTNRVPRSWQVANNRTLRRCDRSFPAGRVVVVDWYRISAGHRSWRAGDGIHHTSAGRAAYVRALDRAVDRYGR